jgi:hypothetical protein
MHPEWGIPQDMGTLRMREGEQQIRIHLLVKFTAVLQIGQIMYLLLKRLGLQTPEERSNYIGHMSTATLAELRVLLRVILELRAMCHVPPDTEATFMTHLPRDIPIPGPRTVAATARIICVHLTKSAVEDTAILLLCPLFPMAMKSQRQAYISVQMAQKSPGQALGGRSTSNKTSLDMHKILEIQKSRTE